MLGVLMRRPQNNMKKSCNWTACNHHPLVSSYHQISISHYSPPFGYKTLVADEKEQQFVKEENMTIDSVSSLPSRKGFVLTYMIK